MSNIPEDIRKQIEDEKERLYGTFETHPHTYGGQRDGFTVGSNYTYSLASSEIESLRKEVERLKGLLEKEYKSHITDVAIEKQWAVSKDELNTYWQQFKQQNQL